MTVSESVDYLLDNTEEWYKDQILHAYSHGLAETTEEVEANMRDPRKWTNPLETRLPRAPNMKIYCFYGIGKETERSYFYRESGDSSSALNVTIDTAVNKDEVVNGIIPGEGDGTVPLLSSGMSPKC